MNLVLKSSGERSPEQEVMEYSHHVIPKGSEVLYRMNRSSMSDRLSIEVYPILSKTAKGCWVDEYSKRKFVLNGAMKRFAYPTREEAAHSFMKRKQRQIKLLAAQLEAAKESLEMVKNYAAKAARPQA